MVKERRKPKTTTQYIGIQPTDFLNLHTPGSEANHVLKIILKQSDEAAHKCLKENEASFYTKIKQRTFRNH